MEPITGTVAVIGGANMDITGIPSAGFVPRDSNPGRVLLSPGGVGRNVCENLARMGAKVLLLTAVGDDLHGSALLESCAALQVDVSCSLVAKERTSSVYLSVNDGDGDMYCAVADMDIVEMLTPEYIRGYEQQLEQCAAIFLDTNLTQESIQYLTETYAHKPIFCDPVSTAKAVKLRGCLDKLHTLKPNGKEAALLSGVPVSGSGDARKAAEALQAMGVRNVAISLGEEGLCLCTEGVTCHYKPRPVKIGSANGAGDALMAGLIYSYLCGLSLEETMKTACAAAAITLADQRTVSHNLSAETLQEEVSK